MAGEVGTDVRDGIQRSSWWTCFGIGAVAIQATDEIAT
jgi:hypothetical protein